MVVQTLGEVPAELRVTPEQDERLAEQARRVGPADVVRLLELIAVALRAMKDGADARTQLELALVKAADAGLDPSVKALLARLERLEAAPAPRRRRPRRRARARRPRRPPPRAARPRRAAARAGRTAVAITAQVEGQPPVAAATTLPGAARGGQAEATARAEQAAAAVAPSSRPRPTGAGGRRRRGRRARRAGARAELLAAVELSPDALAELWPAVLEQPRRGGADARRRAPGRAPGRASATAS